MLSFVKNALNSPNTTVAYIVGLSQFGIHSVLGCNIRLLQTQYAMCTAKLLHTWDLICMEEEENKRLAEQIKELVYMREKCKFGHGTLSTDECNDILNDLCLQ